jgi:hypothetical protein
MCAWFHVASMRQGAQVLVNDSAYRQATANSYAPNETPP